MRLVAYQNNQETRIGLLEENLTRIIHVRKAMKAMKGDDDLPSTLVECIALGDDFVKDLDALKKWISEQPNESEYYDQLEEVKLLAPIPRPLKNIFCVGKNYADHAIEMGSAADIPEHPIIFSKTPTTVIGPNETVRNHQNLTNSLDYEGELAVVIGKKGRGISEEEALDYVFGYTIINDITARDLQNRHKQWLLGKSLDTSCPMGPYLVHKDLIPNPNYLNIETKVNGEVRQSANTEQFIFNVQKIISVISAGTTLEPGDIIATGTPAGVGNGFKPPRFLKPGDRVEITVEGIGTLVNQIEE